MKDNRNLYSAVARRCQPWGDDSNKIRGVVHRQAATVHIPAQTFLPSPYPPHYVVGNRLPDTRIKPTLSSAPAARTTMVRKRPINKAPGGRTASWCVSLFGRIATQKANPPQADLSCSLIYSTLQSSLILPIPSLRILLVPSSSSTSSFSRRHGMYGATCGN